MMATSSSLSLFKSPLAERTVFQPFGMNPPIFFAFSGKFSPKEKIEKIKNNDKINNNFLFINNIPFFFILTICKSLKILINTVF